MGIGQAIGAGLGLINGQLNRNWSEKMYKQSTLDNRRNMALEAGLNEKAAENAQKRAEDFYRKYQTPEAMKRMLKEAGLSIGLMYGMGGGIGGNGSVTTGQMGGASGQSHGTIMNAPMDIASYMTAMSQAELAKAQARKTNVETDELLGDTKRGELTLQQLEASIDNLTSQTDNNKERRALYQAETAMKKVLTEIEGMNLELTKETFHEKVEAIGIANKKMQEEITGLKLRNSITKTQEGALKAQAKLINQKIIEEIINLRVERQFDKKKIEQMTPLIEKAYNDARLSKWQGINEERAYEMFHDKLRQSEVFKDLDIEAERQNTLIRSIFTALGGALAFMKK